MCGTVSSDVIMRTVILGLGPIPTHTMITSKYFISPTPNLLCVYPFSINQTRSLAYFFFCLKHLSNCVTPVLRNKAPELSLVR